MKSLGFIDKVFTFTGGNALFSAPCRLLVAVSGGPDSMALLHSLRHWPQEGLQLSAVHINHGLRGETARRDEEVVRRYCRQHHVPLTVYHEDVSGYADRHKLTLEEAGRVLRYQRFEEVRQEENADWIVTAHTASDQVETMLMHLLRGCGLDAMQGIPVKRGAICRPLLSCTREEVLEYCQENSVPFALDETNRDTRFTRNRIRHEVLPLLRTINPNVDAALLRFQGNLTEDVSYLNRLAEELMVPTGDGRGVSISPLLSADSSIRRRAIRLFLRQQHLKTIEQAHICAVEHLILTGRGTTLLSGGLTARVMGDILTVEETDTTEPEAPVSILLSRFPATITACGKQYTVIVENHPQSENVHNLFAKCAVDYDTIQGDLLVRTRKAGDKLRPAGRGISKSIKKLMNEWELPAEERDGYPLLCDDAGVLLVPGFGCDQRASVTDATKRYLIFRMHE